MINKELKENDKNILFSDKYSSEDLNNIKAKIENMDKVHHIEILKILLSEESNYVNENNNGIFVNLSDLKDNTIQKLKDYIIYFNKQQNQLINLENKKKKIENLFCN